MKILITAIAVITGINFILMLILFNRANKMLNPKNKKGLSFNVVAFSSIQAGFMTCIGLGVLILLILNRLINL